MKSFNQFCAEAEDLLEMDDFSAGGGNAKMQKTGMTRDQVVSLGQKNLARLKNKPAAPKPATGVSTGPAPTPRPKDDKPTIAQVAAVKKAAETQRNRDNLRFGVELGGLAAKSAQQKYANQNSGAARGAEIDRQAAIPQWKKHPFTQNKPARPKTKDRGYGIPDFKSDRRRENRGAMSDNNRYLGMSDAEAEAKATRDEAELNKKNEKYMRNRGGN